MAKANDKSSAKPLHRLKVENISVTVWEGPRVTIQREYVYDRQVGYADSFRVEDVPNLKRALDQFVIWSELPKDDDETAEPEADK